jgi:hypothetical protein
MSQNLSPTSVVDRERMESSLDLHLLLLAMEHTRRTRDVAGNERRDDDDLCGLHGTAAPFEAPICSPHPQPGYSNATDRILY